MRFEVAACIACGTRFRDGECPDGCADVPLRLVDAGPVDELAAHVEALRGRVGALRELDRDAPLSVLRERARAALRTPVPPRDRDVELVDAWGCPECGRIDALRPCLGLCFRRPLLMTDASEYLRLAETADALAGEERELARAARMLANVKARPGHEEITARALRALLAPTTAADV